MTDDQIRIALAEASQGIIEYTEGVWFYWSNGRLFSCKENDPLEDLNACAEFEKTLTRQERYNYSDHLCDMCYDGSPDPNVEQVISATARQRAEAFIRTLNFWKD